MATRQIRLASALALLFFSQTSSAARAQGEPRDAESPDARRGPDTGGASGVAPGQEPVPQSEPGSLSDPPSEGVPESEGEPESDVDPGSESRSASDEESGYRVGDTTVTGRAEEIFHTGGSTQSVNEEVLEQLNFDDPTAILASVAGVYVRQEDGFGLRPNIGIRGASAERSRRVTLMEDGVLLGPAPYSAPAAYYFPLMTRMTGVDVYMGPAAIPYGPHTVGGAIDFRDRPIPTRHQGGLDLGLGSTWFGRFHGHYGDSNDWGGFLVEAVHLRTDGFRRLDFVSGDPSTGFDRTDIVARGELHGDLTDDIYHRLELVAGLGLERSNETYLGLTDADLRVDPFRRYGATGSDRMDWWRTRIMARYELLSDPVDLLVTAYRHDFDRTWQRLDGFVDGTRLFDVLSDPTDGRNAVYYDVLTGVEPATISGQALLRVRNQRAFVSQGIQTRARIRAQTDEVRHVLEVGLRVHYDEVARRHTGSSLTIDSSALLTTPERLLTWNRAQSLALSAHAAYQLRFRGLTVTPGLRLEAIRGEFLDRRSGLFQVTEQAQVLPGLGVTYEVVRDAALFAGVHQGYSPVAPGQPDGTRPELSWNYEIGARYGRVDQPSHGQLAFFLSDYENITGECSGAGGCPEALVDRMFNGDRATILGVEAEGTHTFTIDEARVPVRGNYTYTWTRMATAFVSESPQLGEVSIGDHLPYIPEHQLTAGAGFEWRMLRVNAQLQYVSPMRDTASIGPILPGEGTDEQLYIDAMASVEVFRGIRLYVRGENLTNSTPIVARRPFGARTGRPLLVQGGLEASF
ncbi:MAG: TonB-dependent receptor family protein [Deltaproteobacteria bacterium]|jgi:Fe(3+) dicitrate transport protein